MTRPDRDGPRCTIGEPAIARVVLTLLALGLLTLFLVLPLCVVFAEALRNGWIAFAAAIENPDALSAIRLTLLTAGIALPIDVLFGLAASWAMTKFEFRGRGVILALIELPIAVSPVVIGLIFMLLFGSHGLVGPWLAAHGIRIVFAVPGIVLVTVFVTFPFVARELIPLMDSQGREMEEAAHVLGASGWQIYTRITLPNIRWGLMYGMVLCNARAMGEFGAVSVISGHVSGLTNTIPLDIESLYNEYDFVGAFAMAALLTLLPLVTLAARSLLEWHETVFAGREAGMRFLKARGS